MQRANSRSQKLGGGQRDLRGTDFGQLAVELSPRYLYSWPPDGFAMGASSASSELPRSKIKNPLKPPACCAVFDSAPALSRFRQYSLTPSSHQRQPPGGGHHSSIQFTPIPAPSAPNPWADSRHAARADGRHCLGRAQMGEKYSPSGQS